MNSQFSRTELMLGRDAMEKLSNSTVAIFGVGGVGSFVAEALVRSGLGKIILIDYDTIDISNLNRQIHATIKTIGQFKVEAMKDRLLDINPNLKVKCFKEKYNEETRDFLIDENYDYIVDAIDMISSKLNLIQISKTRNIPIISSMGAGNKLSPTMLQLGDISQTRICPLARVMRKELRKRGIDRLKVVWSEEVPMKINLENEGIRKAIPGSVIFVPSVAGLIIASEVIKDLVLEEVL